MLCEIFMRLEALLNKAEPGTARQSEVVVSPASQAGAVHTEAGP